MCRQQATRADSTCESAAARAPHPSPCSPGADWVYELVQTGSVLVWTFSPCTFLCHGAEWVCFMFDVKLVFQAHRVGRAWSWSEGVR